MKPKDVNDLLAPISPVHEGINSYGLGCSVTSKKAITAEALRKFAAELMITVSQSCIESGAKDGGVILNSSNRYPCLNAVGASGPVDIV